MRYETILVPLDGSERAERILSHVEEMAHRFDARVILMSVVSPPKFHISPYDAHPDLAWQEVQTQVEETEQYLDGVAIMLRSHDLEVETCVEHGPVVNAILMAAQETQASIVAMASHGRSGLSRVFYGSVTAGVLQQIDRPLFVIRAE